jgi:Cu(I)/Ag(I) efflux system membrane fusion protein
MKTKIKKRDIGIIAITLITGLILGWLFFHNSGNKIQHKHGKVDHEEQASLWTCSMHPQVRQDKPGLCPICAMELVPLSSLETDVENVSPDEISMSESAISLADIQTIVVKKGIPEKSVSLTGKVKPDERNISEITARFGGRIEKLFINYKGQNVVKGQKLATIYSPELISAQKELLEALRFKESNPSYYSAARIKLKLWNLSDEQVNSIEKNLQPIFYFEIYSPVSGTVTRRHVSSGDYIKEGSALFEIINLKKIWIMFDAYESDLPWIRIGDPVNFTVQALPGKSFLGNVTYIDPLIDADTRVAKVRVEMSNPGLSLKPEMFVNGFLYSQYAGKSKEILIPKSSILWTGKRSVVYVKVPERKTPSFVYREIVLGPEAGDFNTVADGLREGEEIAVNGVFKIDAAAQLAGKPSMMNPPMFDSLPGKPQSRKVHAGHNHGEIK